MVQGRTIKISYPLLPRLALDQSARLANNVPNDTFLTPVAHTPVEGWRAHGQSQLVEESHGRRSVTARIGVEYSRKVGRDYGSQGFRVSWEFDIPDDANIQEESGRAFAYLKQIVDIQAAESAQPHVTPEMSSGPTRTSPVAQVTEELSQSERIVPNAPVAVTHCRVFKVEQGKWSKSKVPFVKVRIGNEQQIPGQYVDAIAEDAAIMAKIIDGIQLREGDYVDVKGYYQPWRTNAEKFDLKVQAIDRTSVGQS